MKRILIAVALVLFAVSSASAVTALWDHSTTATVFKYRIAWGTTSGNYPSSQEMQKSACVPGIDVDGGPYDCKMALTGTFTDNVTYYFVGYAINYNTSGQEQMSDPTPVVVFTMRPGGNIGTKPSALNGLGIYEK